MIAADTIQLSFRNLREAKLRTSLTALGVAIGIASLVGMVSFGVALQDQVVGSFLRSGVFDSITVTSAPLPSLARGRRPGPMGSGRGRAQAGRPAADRPALDDEALKALSALDKVKEVYPEVRVPVEIKFEDFSEFAAARGVPMSARGEGAFQDIAAGQFFPSDTADVCLISTEFAKRLSEGDPAGLVGKDLTLGFASAAQLAQLGAAGPSAVLNIQRTEKPFKIVGVVSRQAGPGVMGGMFAPLMIPLSRALDMGAADLGNPQAILRQLASKRTYAAVTVKVRRAQDTDEVERKIKELGFNAFSIADLLQNQKKAFILLDLLLGLVGSIALTVASLGIVNTMVMSILERTREIGIMKAIGASDQDVRRIFLIEAGLIGLAGGLFGLVLGWGVGRAINIGANVYLQNQGAPEANLFLIPWWLIAGAMLFAVLVGVVAGGFPASRAARLDPIQALRHD
jgi:putative ABC transport system permease protein